MTLIRATRKSNNAPGFRFKDIGDGIVGRIAELSEYQVRDYETREPKLHPKTGDPIMGLRITLQTDLSDWTSHKTLWVEKPLMIKAIAEAVQAAGADDLEEGGDLAVLLDGRAGMTMLWKASYTAPGADEEAAA